MIPDRRRVEVEAARSRGYPESRTAAPVAITFTGTARPKPGLSTILTFQVYRRVAGVWKLFATRHPSSGIAGTAKLSWRFGTSGDWEVRVRAEATARSSAGAWTSSDRYRVR